MFLTKKPGKPDQKKLPFQQQTKAPCKKSCLDVFFFVIQFLGWHAFFGCFDLFLFGGHRHRYSIHGFASTALLNILCESSKKTKHQCLKDTQRKINGYQLLVQTIHQQKRNPLNCVFFRVVTCFGHKSLFLNPVFKH